MEEVRFIEITVFRFSLAVIKTLFGLTKPVVFSPFELYF